MDFDDIKEKAGKIGMGVLSVGLIGAAVAALVITSQNEAALKKQSQAFAEKMNLRIENDLKNDGLLSFEKGDVTYSFFSAEKHDKMNKAKDDNDRLTAYGTVANAQVKDKVVNVSFKVSYIVDNLKIDSLKELTTFTETLDDHLSFESIEYDDVNALNWGLNEEKMDALKKPLWNTQKTEKGLKSHHKKPDVVLPIYSNVKTSEEGGKHYANLTIEGLDAFVTEEANVAAGVAIGAWTYGAVNQNENYANYAPAAALTAGYAASQLFATENVDSYMFMQNIKVEITAEQANLSSAKLREYVFDKVIEGNEINTEMVSVSNNLNDVALVSNLNNMDIGK